MCCNAGSPLRCSVSQTVSGNWRPARAGAGHGQGRAGEAATAAPSLPGRPASAAAGGHQRAGGAGDDAGRILEPTDPGLATGGVDEVDRGAHLRPH
ncbi:hypothetical protein SDC9_29852 [bioreactor metagenome]|uniref:Uncharacterized protein n=1 Tax=bioreactor metagenome TaxID=1076179 RepID=A0A644UZ02_9ZZZZ